MKTSFNVSLADLKIAFKFFDMQRQLVYGAYMSGAATFDELKVAEKLRKQSFAAVGKAIKQKLAM